MKSNKPPIRGEGAPIVFYGSLGAAEGRVELTVTPPDPPHRPDPPDRFGKWLKVGVQLVGRIFELGQKLGFWRRRRGPAAEIS